MPLSNKKIVFETMLSITDGQGLSIIFVQNWPFDGLVNTTTTSVGQSVELNAFVMTSSV